VAKYIVAKAGASALKRRGWDTGYALKRSGEYSYGLGVYQTKEAAAKEAARRNDDLADTEARERAAAAKGKRTDAAIKAANTRRERKEAPHRAAEARAKRGW
jgi:hypothetical protein